MLGWGRDIARVTLSAPESRPAVAVNLTALEAGCSDLLDLARVGVHEAQAVRALHVQPNVSLAACPL